MIWGRSVEVFVLQGAANILKIQTVAQRLLHALLHFLSNSIFLIGISFNNYLIMQRIHFSGIHPFQLSINECLFKDVCSA
jgi:hypothetical protein